MTAAIWSKLKGKRRIQISILVLACILAASALLLMCSGKEGSHISGNAYYPGKFPLEAYFNYSQRDALWAGDKLGSSKDTMGSSGCLTCCIAASLKAQGICDYTPGQMNQLFNEQGVYNQDGAIVWTALEEALPGVKANLDNDMSEVSINRLIGEGKYPIVKVKRKSGGIHWIMLTGTEEASSHKGSHDITGMDPIAGYVHLSDYSNTIYSVRVVTSTASGQ